MKMILSPQRFASYQQTAALSHCDLQFLSAIDSWLSGISVKMPGLYLIEFSQNSQQRQPSRQWQNNDSERETKQREITISALACKNIYDAKTQPLRQVNTLGGHDCQEERQTQKTLCRSAGTQPFVVTLLGSGWNRV